MNLSEKAEVLREVADEFGHLEDEDGVELRKHLECWITQLQNFEKPETVMVELSVSVVNLWLTSQSQPEAISAAEIISETFRKTLKELK